jgi:hypothetical protein
VEEVDGLGCVPAGCVTAARCNNKKENVLCDCVEEEDGGGSANQLGLGAMIRGGGGGAALCMRTSLFKTTNEFDIL